MRASAAVDGERRLAHRRDRGGDGPAGHPGYRVRRPAVPPDHRPRPPSHGL